MLKSIRLFANQFFIEEEDFDKGDDEYNDNSSAAVTKRSNHEKSQGDFLKLTRIEFCTRQSISQTKSITSILRRSPYLQLLTLDCFDQEIDILSVIGENCPDLRKISTKTMDNRSRFMRNALRSMNNTLGVAATKIGATAVISKKKQSTPLSKTGELQFIQLDNIQSITPLSQRLKISSNTLQAISLSMNVNSLRTAFSDWQPLFSWHVMPRMTTLEITNGCEAFYQFFTSIPIYFPALESLRLVGDRTASLPPSGDVDRNGGGNRFKSVLWDDIVDVVGQLPKLSNLEFEALFMGTMDFRTLLSALEKGNRVSNLIAQHYYKPDLKYLGLISCRNIDVSTMMLITRIKSLQQFVFHCPKDEAFSEPDTRQIIALLGNAPWLHHIELGGAGLPITELIARDIIHTWKIDSNKKKKLTLTDNINYFGRKKDIKKLFMRNWSVYINIAVM
ncbi:hypothetical protein INT45_012273 [Circinella minor]|uniref:Uncharacterized protein n=1 Tax=Circinella minor TaxID=1195481 RepID=A0A8H7S189_9FUNG|nr:hypothetical protein INT45_012273 [Circinella minor]